MCKTKKNLNSTPNMDHLAPPLMPRHTVGKSVDTSGWKLVQFKVCHLVFILNLNLLHLGLHTLAETEEHALFIYTNSPPRDAWTFS
jgi:hypothetical protein